jgi:hypothetical protein
MLPTSHTIIKTRPSTVHGDASSAASTAGLMPVAPRLTELTTRINTHTQSRTQMLGKRQINGTNVERHRKVEDEKYQRLSRATPFHAHAKTVSELLLQYQAVPFHQRNGHLCAFATFW